MRLKIMTMLVSIKVDLGTKAKIQFLRQKEINLSEEYRQLVDTLYRKHGGN